MGRISDGTIKTTNVTNASDVSGKMKPTQPSHTQQNSGTTGNNFLYLPSNGLTMIHGPKNNTHPPNH